MNETRERGVVVDTNEWLHATARLSSTSDDQRANARRALTFFNRRVILDGEAVRLYPIVPRVVLYEIDKVMTGAGRTESEIESVLDQVRKAVAILGGVLDEVVEDRAAMAKASWLHHGTGAPDEMVLTAARRHNAAVLTEDKDFKQYCGDRHVAAFTAEALIESTVAV